MYEVRYTPQSIEVRIGIIPQGQSSRWTLAHSLHDEANNAIQIEFIGPRNPGSEQDAYQALRRLLSEGES